MFDHLCRLQCSLTHTNLYWYLAPKWKMRRKKWLRVVYEAKYNHWRRSAVVVRLQFWKAFFLPLFFFLLKGRDDCREWVVGFWLFFSFNYGKKKNLPSWIYNCFFFVAIVVCRRSLFLPFFFEFYNFFYRLFGCKDIAFFVF